MVDSLSAADSTSSRNTFYRKNFTKARGCINEVNELADAAALLCEACAHAVAGEADIEQVDLSFERCFALRAYRSCRTSRTSRPA
jgi:hypothetical protein